MVELLITMLIMVVVAAMAVPQFQSVSRYLRIAGDSRALFATASQAKMQAGAQFTHSRARIDLSANQYYTEVWDRTKNVWTTVGGVQPLSKGVTPGLSATIAAAPAGTQASVSQAGNCFSTAPGSLTPATIANTSCIEFNSRGVPVDNSGSPIATNAFYITDGTSVYAVTVSITGMVQDWSTDVNSTGSNWMRR